MVVNAWKFLSAELIQKSFLCCGQVPDATAADISCFKDGRPAAEGRQQLLELYTMSATELVHLTATPSDDADDERDVDALVLGDADTEFEDVDVDEDETPRVPSQPSPLPPPPLDRLTSPLPTRMQWPADS